MKMQNDLNGEEPAFANYPSKESKRGRKYNYFLFNSISASTSFLSPRICGSIGFGLGVTGQLGSACGAAW